MYYHMKNDLHTYPGVKFRQKRHDYDRIDISVDAGYHIGGGGGSSNLLSSHYFRAPSLSNSSDPGSHSGPSSPLPTTVRAFVFIASIYVILIRGSSRHTPAVESRWTSWQETGRRFEVSLFGVYYLYFAFVLLAFV